MVAPSGQQQRKGEQVSILVSLPLANGKNLGVGYIMETHHDVLMDTQTPKFARIVRVLVVEEATRNEKHLSPCCPYCCLSNPYLLTNYVRRRCAIIIFISRV